MSKQIEVIVNKNNKYNKIITELIKINKMFAVFNVQLCDLGQN